jgi:hypothetical protein
MRLWIPFFVALSLLCIALFVRCGEVGFDPCEGVECDDRNQCTDDSCDVASGVCSYTATPENTPCDFDGLPGLCRSGVCEDAGLCEGMDCDDENPCTNDDCEAETGVCIYTAIAENTPCNFGGLPGLCKSGECEDARLCEGVSCNDDNQCTEDVCNRANGKCVFTAVPDNTICSFGGAPGLCMSGQCEDARLCEGVLCNDDNECTEDVCNPANGECVFTAVPDNTMCDFSGLPGLCASGLCMDAELCEGVVCDDDNDCTEDLCIPMSGDCSYVAVPDDTSCDFEGLPGVCASGVCNDAALCEGIVCDGNPCVFNPPPCDPFTGRCPSPTEFVAAGTLCDLATVDDGRCDGSGGCIQPQGDLEPVGVSFDANHLLQVSIKNRSPYVVPPNVGNVRVFVDGVAVGDIPLEALHDDSYRQPYSSQAITLNVRLAGENRRIAVDVDTHDEILERNEDHNHYTRTITPPVTSGPDLVVSALLLDAHSGTLSAEIRNSGTLNSPAMQVELEVRLDDVFAESFTRALPALNVNESRVIDASPTAAIKPGSKVRVTVRTDTALDEIDTTNQSRTAFFPTDSALADYVSLLSHPKIAGTLRWENAAGVTVLTSAQTTDVLEKIRQLELGQPVSAPLPSVDWPLRYSESEAWEIFAVNAAHSLWVEKNELVDWKLVDMSDEHVASMLDGRKWFTYAADSDDYEPLYGSITPRNPSASYDFFRSFGMIQRGQLETIHALTKWVRARLIHASGQDWEEQYGYAGLPPVDRILFPLAGRLHITPGCSGTAGIYVAMLRAINIPSERAFTPLGGSMHCRPDFPTVDRSMPHGDDPYSSFLTNSSQSVPIEMVFYTDAEMNALFLEPIPDCNDEVCNTVGQQACHNLVRNQILRSFENRGDYLAHQYQMYGPEHLRDRVLHGIPIGGEYVTYARPLFTEKEKEAIISSVEDHLAELGSGDIELGKVVIGVRVSEWAAAKTTDFWSVSQLKEPEFAPYASLPGAGCAP